MKKERIKERKLEKRDEGGERKMASVEDLMPSPPLLVRKRERGEFGGGRTRGAGEFPVAIVLPHHREFRAAAPQKPPSKWKVSDREEEDNEAVKVWTITVEDSIVAITPCHGRIQSFNRAIED
ncbi:hypothetical protein PIB30_024172 [Stylosanthes scabra]|uniref:Uncharacterized protein n=1 Tax=Stylosanthes scabra TaxID=79078 RepID=A0ABU6Y8A2_9FABA|nr:hypothetical protein [Stylosanthes scabra]